MIKPQLFFRHGERLKPHFSQIWRAGFVLAGHAVLAWALWTGAADQLQGADKGREQAPFALTVSVAPATPVPAPAPPLEPPKIHRSKPSPVQVPARPRPPVAAQAETIGPGLSDPPLLIATPDTPAAEGEGSATEPAVSGTVPAPGGQGLPASPSTATASGPASSVSAPVSAVPQPVAAPGLAVLRTGPALTFAAFPVSAPMTFEVHSPKDYLESGGASGTAIVTSRADTDASGSGRYEIGIEIRLGWLLRKVIGGSLNYRSEGLVGGGVLQTSRYAERVGDRPERWLELDPDRTQMRAHHGAVVPALPGAQDRLSAIWLIGMLARGDIAQLEKGRKFSVPMYNFRKTYTAHFESLGNEVLESPAGVLQALHVRYRTDEADADTVDLWLGYEQEMLPVRIRWQEAQGRVIDLILKSR